jgi:hypothetical protein
MASKKRNLHLKILAKINDFGEKKGVDMTIGL